MMTSLVLKKEMKEQLLHLFSDNIIIRKYKSTVDTNKSARSSTVVVEPTNEHVLRWRWVASRLMLFDGVTTKLLNRVTN